MAKHYTTVDSWFGTKVHYDENGRYAGESMPGLTKGSMIHYDANGNFAGRTDPGWFGTQVHTDSNGNYAGESMQGWSGQRIHSDASGRCGVSWDTFFGTVTDFDDDV